jgi:hypothetical protein
MQIIAESGMVHTTTVFITFLVSASGSNAVYIAADMVNIPIIAHLQKVDHVTIKSLPTAGTMLFLLVPLK